jgi:two-component system, NarL family, nitrate/nitrite response regulator NarL
MSLPFLSAAVLHGNAAHCDALCDAIADDAGFRVVGGTNDAASMLEMLGTATVHVLVIDVATAGDETPELISAVRAASPRTGILLLVHGQGAPLVEELMARGAGGYLDAARTGTDLAGALRTIGMGRRYLPTAAASAG